MATTDTTDVVGEDVVYMLTTDDNPYNPFDEFDRWWTWDELKGYHSCGLLAKYVTLSTELPQWMQDEARNEAIDLILEEAIHARFKKVSRADYSSKPKDSEETDSKV